MNINDLKAGDILLFSPEKGSFISWAITYLTDAPVSHAAMFYVSALESASVFSEISSSHLKSITSSLDFHHDHSRTC